jgi:hypothetical protein
VATSLGANLAFDYLKDARPFTEEDSVALDIETREALYLFDVLLLNVDRSANNFNLLIGLSDIVEP